MDVSVIDSALTNPGFSLTTILILFGASCVEKTQCIGQRDP